MTHAPPAIDILDNLVALKEKLPHFFKALYDKRTSAYRGDGLVVDRG